MSLFRFLLNPQYIIFLWPGLNPSRTQGMLLSRSARENKMSSLLMKSLYGISEQSWSKKVPGWKELSHLLRSSTCFLEKTISISLPSSSHS